MKNNLARKIKLLKFITPILTATILLSLVSFKDSYAECVNSAEQSTKTNPLFQKPGLPKFDKIKPEHFKPAIIQAIEKHQSTVKKLIGQKEYTWENFIDPLAEADQELGFIWNTIDHLKTVNGTEEIRKTYKECLPIASKYFTKHSQDEKIYQIFKQITEDDHYRSLNNIQKKIINDELRDFYLNGINLPPENKKRLAELKERLVELGDQFSNNLLDSTQKHLIKITEKEAQGLPESAIALAKENAKKHNHEGLVFTLDAPSIYPLIKHVDCRKLRKKAYIALATRASDQGNNKKLDNSKIIEEFIKIRKEIAEILGFKNYAEYNIADKSVTSTDQVINFLHELTEKSLPKAKQELKELENFAKKDGIKKLDPWDVTYYEEKLRKQKFNISQEELRSYFPAPQAISGIFEIIKRIYGVTYKERKDVPVWHKDVRFFELYDGNNNLLGSLYVDLYYRDNKEGGARAYYNVARHTTKNGKIRHPVAYLICNFSPPIDDKPSLLTHKELNYLLHEFGHILQYLLTKIDYLQASCIGGLPYDTIEIASQFMENYAWKKEGLELLAKHYQNNQPLPKDKLKQLLASRTFIAATLMLRQLELGLSDFNLYLEQPSSIKNAQNIVNKVRKKVRLTPYYKHDRFLHTFNHIFGFGYAAGYYGYKWSEAMSADAFSKFEEKGIFNRKTGQEFLDKFLSLGGSEDPLVMFKNFRGRPPTTEPLLRQAGIILNYRNEL